METQKVSDMSLDVECLRVLLYGPAGAGKTTLAGTFPKPIIFFDFDGKLKSLLHMDGIDTDGIEYINYSFDSPSKASACWRRFWKDFRDFKKDTRFKTAVFDSLTAMDILLLAHCMTLSGKGPTDKPTLPVYGEQSGIYRHMFMEMNSIRDKNIILIGHNMEVRDADGEGQGAILEISPLITGQKIRPKLPAMFEEIYYMERKGGAGDLRTLHYIPYRKAVASSTILRGKSGKLDSPTYETIIQEAKKGA